MMIFKTNHQFKLSIQGLCYRRANASIYPHQRLQVTTSPPNFQSFHTAPPQAPLRAQYNSARFFSSYNKPRGGGAESTFANKNYNAKQEAQQRQNARSRRNPSQEYSGPTTAPTPDEIRHTTLPATIDEVFSAESEQHARSWWERNRPRAQLTKPMKMEEDLPSIVDKNDGKTPPVVFLPKSNWDWWKVWNIPEVVVMPRKRFFAAYAACFMGGTTLSVLTGLWPALDLLKDAERKHNVLKQEVVVEERQLNYLHSVMTPEEIEQSIATLPHRPGVEWNPHIEEEQKRLSARVFYPT